MNQAFGVEEKYRQLKMRKDEQRKLGQHIDQIVRQAETADQPKGCFPATGCYSRILRQRPSRLAPSGFSSTPPGWLLARDRARRGAGGSPRERGATIRPTMSPEEMRRHFEAQLPDDF